MNNISPAIFRQPNAYCFHLGRLFEKDATGSPNLTVEYRPSGRLRGGSITPEQYELFRSLDQGRELDGLTVDEKGILLSFARQDLLRLVDLDLGPSELSTTAVRWQDGFTLKSQDDAEELAIFESTGGTEFTVNYLEWLILAGMTHDATLAAAVDHAILLIDSADGGRAALEADIEDYDELRGTSVEQALTGKAILLCERLRALGVLTLEPLETEAE